MRTHLEGSLALLDETTKDEIATARERAFGRLRGRIDEVNVRIDPVARTGGTLCQVTVRTADRIQVLARHRDRDALRAVMTALQSARRQVVRGLHRARRRRMAVLAPAAP
jgi:hypothetical protein